MLLLEVTAIIIIRNSLSVLLMDQNKKKLFDNEEWLNYDANLQLLI